MKTCVGDLVAYLKPQTAGGKAKYITIGKAFTDDTREGISRFSFVIDTVPVSPRWEGWCNVFEPRGERAGGSPPSRADMTDDEVPF